MINILPIFNLILYFLITILLIRVLLSTFRNFFLDNPIQRSSHTKATPSGAGIIFVIAALISSLHTDFFNPILCLPLAIVGFIDDHKSLSPFIRIFAQFITVLFLLIKSPLLINLEVLNGVFLIFSIIIIFLFSALLINFFNFFDGLDSLLVLNMLVILITISFYSESQYWPFCGSLLGFLYFNRNPAKVFMGDGGSTFLGAIFIGIIFEKTSFEESLSILLLATPIIADCLSCMIKRFFYGQPLLKPHKLHLFQRLHQAGFSHNKVSLIYSSCTLLISITLIYENIMPQIFVSSLVIMFGIYLNNKYAVPFEKVMRN